MEGKFEKVLERIAKLLPWYFKDDLEDIIPEDVEEPFESEDSPPLPEMEDLEF